MMYRPAARTSMSSGMVSSYVCTFTADNSNGLCLSTVWTTIADRITDCPSVTLASPGVYRHASLTAPSTEVTATSPLHSLKSSPGAHLIASSLSGQAAMSAGSDGSKSSGLVILRPPERRAGSATMTGASKAGCKASACAKMFLPTLCRAMASRARSRSDPTTVRPSWSIAATSVPMEQVTSATASTPRCASLRARASATTKGVACCAASEEKIQSPGSLLTAERRAAATSMTARPNSPQCPRRCAESAIRDFLVSASWSASSSHSG